MNERLLHYIWQFRYFNPNELLTSQGQQVQVLAPGEYNTNQGPDFANARIKLDSTIWAGPVELHLKTSDWNRHGHTSDGNYNKVILHVVWHHDLPENNADAPVLELQPHVPAMMLDQYEKWMHSTQAVPCGNQLQHVNTLTITNWKDRMLSERQLQKMHRIQQHLQQTSNHWEEVFWRLLCRYFGGNVNGESFEQVAVSLPVSLLAKHKNQIHQLEALLLGQAGLLHKNDEDKYCQMLYTEYQFLQKKYGLRVVNKPPAYLRLRPVNFPSVRLAQLAMLIHKSLHLFSRIREADQLKQVWRLLDVTANDYWNYHYKPGIEAEHLPKHVGRQIMETVLINAICPVLFAYGKLNAEQAQVEKALNWLQQVPAEKNVYTRAFEQYHLEAMHAYDSQAMIQLKKEYCDARRCLECAIGNAMLRKNLAAT